jgi:7,8-dihydropterin-6-yl-methyl-4-(beta-D-ribofuranosyl)aminobenzene 5'-phosphate synthase
MFECTSSATYLSEARMERSMTNKTRLTFSAIGTLVFCLLSSQAPAADARHVGAAKITVLSTMLADRGIGEWGFAALVEVDGKRFLFDTGARPETVLSNAREMRIDLSNVEDVIVSHNHGDHTGGLITLRRELQKQNPRALIRAHVGEGIFTPRSGGGADNNGLTPFKSQYEALGGQFITHAKATELAPGVWFTGPVARVHPEKNYPPSNKLKLASGDVEDNVPEDSSLVIATDEGLIVLSGCGHAGIINTVEQARKTVEAKPIVAVIGGLHTFGASDEVLAWTAAQLKSVGIRYLLAGHCTGIEAAFRIRQLAGLDRKTAVVSSVGSSFTLGKGIDPLSVAR